MKSCLKKLFKVLVAVSALLFILVFIIFTSNILKTPSLDRDWAEDSKVLPDISISENIIEIKNIRDWRYEKEAVISKDYYDETFDLNKIKKTYLLFNPFGKWEGIGHFFFVFEFEGGQTVSVSIEARRESDEGYNSIKGVFNKYELWYAYGSSADFITRRGVFYNDQELYMYPLEISEKYTRALFLDLAQTTESLESNPEFYNTVTSNCTNLLAKSANRVKEGSVPFHYSRLFTGFTDDQLYKLGFIRNDKSFEEVYRESRIDLEVKEVNLELGDYTNDEFWESFIFKQI